MAVKKKNLGEEFSMGDLLDSCSEGEPYIPQPIEIYVPTGICLLDWAIGTPGWPTGRVVELYGHDSSGKSGLALMAIRNAIQLGGCGAYLDCEHGFDHNRLKKIGMSSMEGLVLREAETLEELHKKIETLVRNHHKFPSPMVIVWDSFCSVSSKSAVKKDDASVALEPRINSAWFRKRILRLLNGTPVCLLILNQIRDTMNMWNPAKKTASPGGRALKHYASLRVELSEAGKIKPRTVGDDYPGIYINAVVKKNRLGPSYRTANFPFYFERPVDDTQILIRYATQKNILKTTDSGRVVYQDKAMLKQQLWNYLRENSEDLEALRESCRVKFGHITPTSTLDLDMDEDEEA